MLAWLKGVEDAELFLSAVTLGEIQAGVEITREQDKAKVAEVDHLLRQVIAEAARGEALVILSEDREVTPNEAAQVLGLSRPLVVQRMNAGELPFRMVGAHRRVRLEDVLALKERLEAQRAGLRALAEDTEDLIMAHGL